MSAEEGAKRRSGIEKPARQPRSIGPDNIDALFAMDHLPIYSQRYRQARGLAVDAEADEEKPLGAIDDAETSTTSTEAASATTEEEKDIATKTAHAMAKRNQHQGMDADARPKPDIRELRLGRVTRKRPDGTRPPATPALTKRHGLSPGILASVRRRCVPSRRSGAESARPSRRQWRWTGAAIMFLALTVVTWPTKEVVEEIDSGQGGPVITLKQEVVAIATAVPEKAPPPRETPFDGDREAATAPAALKARRAEPSDPPNAIETFGAPIGPESITMADREVVSETALAAIVAAVTRDEAQEDATFFEDDPNPVDLAPSAPAEVPEEAIVASNDGATSGDVVEALALAEAGSLIADPSYATVTSHQDEAPADPEGPRDVATISPSGSQAAFDSRIVVHIGAGDPPDAVMRALVDAGYRQPELRRVDFTVSATNVRYFFADDRPDAERIDRIVAEASQVETLTSPRDFTHYRPLPIQDTIEVWVTD